MTGRRSKQQVALRTGTITAIQVQKKDPARRSVFIDGHFSVGVRGDVLQAAGVVTGDAVTTAELEQLVQADRDAGMYYRALDLLARRRRSVAEIRRFLVRKSASESVIHETIQRLLSAGLLDDGAFAAVFADERRQLKSHGPARIRRDLLARGVAPAVIDEALNATFEDDNLEESAYQLLLRRRPALVREPDVRRRTRKAVAYLVRRGYSYEVAFGAFRRMDLPAGPHA